MYSFILQDMPFAKRFNHIESLNMKKLLLLLMGMSVMLELAAQNKPAAKPAAANPAKTTAAPKPLLQNGLDSLSYAIGNNIGQSIQMQGIDQLNYTLLSKAIEDVLQKKQPLMDQNTAMNTIQQKLQEFMMKKINVQKEEGRAFLAKNKAQQGIVELPSGIQYKVLQQGTGVKPTVADTVTVHYRGTLINGNVFDDSYSRGTPIEFPLGNLIEGWKQTLVLMPVGSKWMLYIPSDYGYGDRGAGANIPGGATLLFEIELLGVKPVKE